jgi:hypothetical protein
VSGLPGGAPQTVETVRTWGSTTNAVLVLREHLINEQVSFTVLREALESPRLHGEGKAGLGLRDQKRHLVSDVLAGLANRTLV